MECLEDKIKILNVNSHKKMSLIRSCSTVSIGSNPQLWLPKVESIGA